MKKRIAYTVILAVLASAALLVGLRWKVWFHNAPEPAYAIEQSIEGVQLSPASNACDGVWATWRGRKEQSMPRLFYCQSTDTIEARVDSLHHASPGGEAAYFYAEIKGVSGALSYLIVADDTLFTADAILPDRNAFKILVLGDIQDKGDATSTQQLIEQIVQRENPSLIVQTGDLIERPHERYYRAYFDAFASARTSIAMLVAAGNHDYIKGVHSHIDERYFYTFAPPLLRAGRAPSEAYREVVIGDLTLYVLDSNQPMRSLASQSRKLAHSAAGIVISHHPLRSTLNPLRHPAMHLFAKSIKRGKHTAFIAGHEHTYSFLPLYNDKKCYQIVTHFSEKSYSGSNKRHYTVIEKNGNSLLIKTFDSRGACVDSLQIK